MSRSTFLEQSGAGRCPCVRWGDLMLPTVLLMLSGVLPLALSPSARALPCRALPLPLAVSLSARALPCRALPLAVSLSPRALHCRALPLAVSPSPRALLCHTLLLAVSLSPRALHCRALTLVVPPRGRGPCNAPCTLRQSSFCHRHPRHPLRLRLGQQLLCHFSALCGHSSCWELEGPWDGHSCYVS